MLSKRVILRTGCPDPNSNMAVASSMASSKVPAGNSGVRRVRLDFSAPPSARARPLRGLLFAGAFFAGGAPCDLFTDALTFAGVGVVGRATPSVEVCDGSRSLGSDGETPLTSAVPRWMSITGQDTFDRHESGGSDPPAPAGWFSAAIARVRQPKPLLLPRARRWTVRLDQRHGGSEQGTPRRGREARLCRQRLQRA